MPLDGSTEYDVHMKWREIGNFCRFKAFVYTDSSIFISNTFSMFGKLMMS